MISAKVIKDSIANGVRLTTMEVEFHRFILPELNTHRMFSRNYTSSRAIPTTKMVEQVRNNPAMPVYWGKNKAGMQAVEEVDWIDDLKEDWKSFANDNANYSAHLSEMGLHKQITNRLIEPFMWTRGIITATEFKNFFDLRVHPAAQPEIQALARAMKEAMDNSKPTILKIGEWHLPYITEQDKDLSLEEKIKSSAARCARVSYNKHDGSSPSLEDDLELFNQLVTRPYTDKRGFHYAPDEPIHGSPLEHQATPMKSTYYPNGSWRYEEGITHIDRNLRYWSGNFRGFIQYRKLQENL